MLKINWLSNMFSRPSLEENVKAELHAERRELDRIEGIIIEYHLHRELSRARINTLTIFQKNHYQINPYTGTTNVKQA